MTLNYQQVKDAALLKNIVEENFTNSTYNLRAGDIITMDGKDVDEYDIPPQGMVLVISSEEFDMQTDTVGYTTVKNALSIKGVMAINIGIVDAGYKGPISSVLMNFGKESCTIRKNETFLRMTFHKFDKPAVPIKTSFSIYHDRQVYVEARKKDARLYLDKKFLSLNAVKNQITNELLKRIVTYIGVFLTASALIGAIIHYVGAINDRLDKVSVNSANVILKNRLDSLIKVNASQSMISRALMLKMDTMSAQLKSVKISGKKQ
jgi:deoxycytidine triphosphate deaminase